MLVLTETREDIISSARARELTQYYVVSVRTIRRSDCMLAIQSTWWGMVGRIRDQFLKRTARSRRYLQTFCRRLLERGYRL